MDKKAVEMVEALLNVLPDSIHEQGGDWTWCWDELSGESQDEVKEVRKRARAFISERNE